MHSSHVKSYSFKSKKGKTLLHTSSKEIYDLIIAWLAISLAFAISSFSGQSIDAFFTSDFLKAVILSGVTVGISFLFHELAHKIVAQRYNCWAEFRADIQMLLIGLAISIFGVVFMAPGAVMIFGRITERQNGIISLAGPLTNIVMALIMLPLLFIQFQWAILNDIVAYSYIINSFLALFNMIPAWNFDGAKIFRWSKPIYFATVIVAAFMVFIYFV